MLRTVRPYKRTEARKSGEKSRLLRRRSWTQDEEGEGAARREQHQGRVVAERRAGTYPGHHSRVTFGVHSPPAGWVAAAMTGHCSLAATPPPRCVDRLRAPW